MSKISLDKYYTSLNLAKYCIDKTFGIIGEENITEIIEPSAGDGSFSNQIENCIAYDIEPENKNIIKQDFLTLDLNYKKGRLIIGNPPFGDRGNMITKFYNKSIELADYVAFILPIKYKDNDAKLYKFDLVYSEDLGVHKYSNINIHCCFNIYKRPKYGLNKKPDYRLKDVTIYRDDYKDYKNLKYDICICRRGVGLGKERLINTEKQTYKIIINNNELKEDILNFIRSYNWLEDIQASIQEQAPCISKTDIYIKLKNNIPKIS